MFGVAFFENVARIKTFLETSVDEMDEFCPVHKDLVLKTLWKQILNLRTHMSVFKLWEDLVFKDQFVHVVLYILLGELQLIDMLKQSLFLSESKRQVFEIIRGEHLHHLVWWLASL